MSFHRIDPLTFERVDRRVFRRMRFGKTESPLFQTFAISLFKIRSSRPLVEPIVGTNRLIVEKSRLQSQAGKALPHNAPAPEDRSAAATIRESESVHRRLRMQDCR